MTQIYNFSAGPAVLPKEVLAQARDEMMDWHGSGMSVMEMSHRGKEFMGIAAEAEADLPGALPALAPGPFEEDHGELDVQERPGAARNRSLRQRELELVPLLPSARTHGAVRAPARDPLFAGGRAKAQFRRADLRGVVAGLVKGKSKRIHPIPARRRRFRSASVRR